MSCRAEFPGGEEGMGEWGQGGRLRREKRGRAWGMATFSRLQLKCMIILLHSHIFCIYAETTWKEKDI